MRKEYVSLFIARCKPKEGGGGIVSGKGRPEMIKRIKAVGDM